MSTTRKGFTAVLIAGALLAGACSDGGSEEASENPKQAFTDAIEALADYEGITMVMSVEADADDIASEELPVEAAEQLVDSSITISAKGETADDAQAEFSVNVGGNEDAVELKILDQSLYLRAEVGELVEAFGGNPADVDLAVEQASAAGLDFAQPLANGEWVGIEGVDKLVEQFTGVTPTTDPEQAAALQDRIVEIFEDTAEVTSEGSDDVGEHLLVRVPLKQFAEDTFAALEEVGGASTAGLPPAGDLDQIPADTELPLDAWIDDGALVQLELDFIALAEDLAKESAPEGIDDVRMRFTFEEFTEEVEAPSDFTAINLEEILQGFFGAMGATTPEVSAPDLGDREVVLPELGLACSDLQTLSPEEIKTFLDASGTPGAFKKIRQACPELF